MPHRHQFRSYAEHCLRLAEFSDSSEQQSALNATAMRVVGVLVNLAADDPESSSRLAALVQGRSN
jgi:hypothetical protein